MRAQQVVQRRDRLPPRQFAAGGQPFRVLIEHRVDDVHERLVAVEQSVPPGQQIAFQPALAQVLGEHLHHPTGRCEVFIVGHGLRKPHLVGRLVDRVQAVGGGLIGSHQTEPVAVPRDHVPQERAEHPSGLMGLRARLRDGYRVLAKVGQVQVMQQQTAVGVRVGAHPPVTGRCQGA